MSYFEKYEDARIAAVKAVRLTGHAHGIEKWSSPLAPKANFRVFPLPSPPFRSGHETTCEAVEVHDAM